MNRRIYTGVFVAIVCVAFGLLTGCSSSNNTPSSIAATSGTPQSATVGAAFASPLVATVTNSGGHPVSGATVTWAAPASGASCTPSATTSTTGSDGTASITCTANSTSGTYNVTATVGSVSPANFALTNNASVANYVFYLSGQEAINGGPNYYAIAGALSIDSNGNVLGGEEDYNDAFGMTSPGDLNSPPTPDTIASGGTLVVDANGTGTLTIQSSFTATGDGVTGTQVFAVQFANPNHALITQFDGSATSSGSLDLQSAVVDTSWAFTMSGVNPSYDSVAFGGVFSMTSGSGTLDVNDWDGGTAIGTGVTITAATPDSFGRVVVSGFSNPAYAAACACAAPLTLAAYPLGPEAIRVIDIDASDSAVGSAIGQGSATFDDTALSAAAVFAESGQWDEQFATVGQFTALTDGSGTISAGNADDNELDNAIQQEAAAISGSYDVLASAINGYGTMSLSGNGNATTFGLYMVSPTVNINDPNNTTDLGGALVLDQGFNTVGGVGVVTLQTDTTATDFTGNYAAGFQNFNVFAPSTCVATLSSGFACELDMNGQFTMTSGALSTGTSGASDSDPFGTWTGTPAESTADLFTSTPLAGGSSGTIAGYFSMSQGNTVSNPLAATINTSGPFPFDADIYQASATTLYWIEFDNNGVFLGPIEGQSNVVKVRAAKRPVAKAKPNQRKAIVYGVGGGRLN